MRRAEEKERRGGDKSDRGRNLRVSFVSFSPLFLFSLFLFAITATAQLKSDHGWLWQNPLPQGNTLYSIHFASDNLTGFAVGDDRTILRTEDGGFTWQNQFSPVDATLAAIFTRDNRSAVIVGARGTILITDDGGKQWRPVPNESKDHLYGVDFAAPGHYVGWAVGSYGRILKSIDGGQTWISQNAGTNEHLLRVSALDDKRAVIAGANGLVLVTTDGGNNWFESRACNGGAVSAASFIT